MAKRKSGRAKVRLSSSRAKRWFYIAAGTFFLVLGVIGIVLPVLPTTPFLLLTAACYARGSERLHNWLLNNKAFGKYITDYQTGRGIPLRAKVGAIAFLWVTIFISIYFFISNFYIQMLLIIIAGFVTAHLAMFPTRRR